MKSSSCFLVGIRTPCVRRALLAVWIGCFAAPAGAELYALVTLRHGNEALGTVRIELDAVRAPRPVANFVGLATGQAPWIDPADGQVRRNTPFYDGLLFHRLIHGFMVQGGDPSATGTQGPGYVFQDQFHPDLRHDPYAVSMAHSGPHSNGSQFFLMFENAAPNLDDYHSVFGRVTDPDSRAILDRLSDPAQTPTGGNDGPLADVIMESVVIGGSGLDTFDIFDPAHRLPRVGTVVSEASAPAADADPVVFGRLQWPAEDLNEYPIRLTQDLSVWSPSGNLFLKMDGEETAWVHLQAPPPGSGFFLDVARADYSGGIVAPADILAPGVRITFEVHGGTLRVDLDPTAADAGAWSFTSPVDGVSTGRVTQAEAGLYGLAGSPVYPGGADVIVEAPGEFRFLSMRALYLHFDPPFGPYDIRDLETHLSFHAPLSGWFSDDWYNGQEEVKAFPERYLRGSFQWQAPD